MKKFSSRHIHLLFAVVLFLLLTFLRQFTDIYYFPYGYGEMSSASVLLVCFGLYLSYVAALYLKNTYEYWKKRNKWIKNLMKTVGLLILFSYFIMWLIPFIMGNIFDFFISSSLTNIFLYSPIAMLFSGYSIVFPFSCYSLYISMKSLKISKKKKDGKNFGISLLIISLIFLITSFFVVIGLAATWIAGGFRT